MNLRQLIATGKTIVAPGATDALSAMRRRICKPAMIVDMPGRKIEQHRAASIVLYYTFSMLVQFDALNSALKNFRSDQRPGNQHELEDFLGYGEFAARARR